MSAVTDFPVKPEARPYLDVFAEDARKEMAARAAAGSRPLRPGGFPSRRSGVALSRFAAACQKAVVTSGVWSYTQKYRTNYRVTRPRCAFLLDGSYVSAVLAMISARRLVWVDAAGNRSWPDLLKRCNKCRVAEQLLATPGFC